MILSKLKFSDGNFYLITFPKKNVTMTKKIVKAIKNDCYFNRFGCSLNKNKARLSG